MRHFRSIVILRCPRETLWLTVRDSLVAIAERIPDVKSVTQLERVAESADQVRILNRWCVAREIPDFIKPLVGTSELGWLDSNVWNEREKTCHWQIEASFLAGHVACKGTTIFEPAMAGRGTRITLEGMIDLDAKLFAGFMPAMQRQVAGFSETIIVTLIPKNLRAVLEVASTLAGPDHSSN